MNEHTAIQVENRRFLFLELYNALEDVYGPTKWWPADTPFEVCIGAILTQNAPWSGVVKSITNLRDAGLFDVYFIAETPEDILANAIRSSIYYNQKARKIKTFCRFLVENFDGRIENMNSRSLIDARNMLLSLQGIGRETADSILLYALHKPIFVVDAYTRRIFIRHGLVDPLWDYERLRLFFEEAVEPDVLFFSEFHALLCLLGAFDCKRKPVCGLCPARKIIGESAL